MHFLFVALLLLLQGSVYADVDKSETIADAKIKSGKQPNDMALIGRAGDAISAPVDANMRSNSVSAKDDPRKRQIVGKDRRPKY